MVAAAFQLDMKYGIRALHTPVTFGGCNCTSLHEIVLCWTYIQEGLDILQGSHFTC